MIKVTYHVVHPERWDPITNPYYVKMDKIIECAELRKGRWGICINRGQGIAWYIISKKSHAKLQAFIDGEDNPILQLVHELRYNPLVGVEPNKLKRSYESIDFIK